jgi:hypothetical protein
MMGVVLLGIANFLGELLGVVGMLVFGAGAAWLLVSALRQGEKPWQFHAVLYGVFFALAAVIVWRASPGDLGAFALGAGGGVLYWSFMKPKQAEGTATAPEPPAPVEAPKNAE